MSVSAYLNVTFHLEDSCFNASFGHCGAKTSPVLMVRESKCRLSFSSIMPAQHRASLLPGCWQRRQPKSQSQRMAVRAACTTFCYFRRFHWQTSTEQGANRMESRCSQFLWFKHSSFLWFIVISGFFVLFFQFTSMLLCRICAAFDPFVYI